LPYLNLVSGQRLFYEIDDWTDPWRRPETIVMIHGFCESTRAYDAWVPHLGRHYRVIRFDQLGFGQSSAVADDFTFTTELLVGNVARIIDEVAGGPVHLIGAKSGGLIALEAAAMRPDLVKTITLASTALDAPQPGQWIEHMDTQGMKSWARLTMPPRLGSTLPPEGFEWWVDLMGATALSTAHVYLRWVSKLDVAKDLDRVKCPVLVLKTQTPRRAYSQADMDVYRDKLSHAEHAAIAVDGYHVSATAPDECARMTLEFLGRHTPQP
jgi:3-oxoadipate enol-lactonase